MVVGMIVILLFAYSSQFPNMQKRFDKSYENIEITFFDHSMQKVNPSGKIIIDGQVVYKINSISESIYQDKEINLKKGKHVIEISTIDGQYYLVDTIEVTKYPMKYKLWIRFNYNPPVNEYKQIVINHIYKRSIKEKDYTEGQKQRILEQVKEKIDQKFQTDLTYTPTDRYFTFTFKDITNYPIE